MTGTPGSRTTSRGPYRSSHWPPKAAPGLVALPGVGPETAGQLLTSAGGNPDRLRSEAPFVHLCGAAPVSASSGRTNRHRLNRGGDRQANTAPTDHLTTYRSSPRHRPTAINLAGYPTRTTGLW